MPPRRSAASAPADARNQPATFPLRRTPAPSRSPPMSASRYPIERRSRLAVAPLSSASPHMRFAASGAMRNDSPDARRIVPAATAMPSNRRAVARAFVGIIVGLVSSSVGGGLDREEVGVLAGAPDQ